MRAIILPAMNSMSAGRTDAELSRSNRRFYDSLWSEARLIEPERFNTWPLVRSLVASSRSRVEVGPGLRPRLPLRGTQFIDISGQALARLRERGGQVVMGSILSLPYADGAFDLVCALDILEHLDDEDRVLSELSRISCVGAAFLIATPLHPSHWTRFDDFVGHRRRYEPQRLLDKLGAHGFAVEQSAVYGMQVKSSRVLDWGMWWMTHQRERAMWWYNRVMMPLVLRFQKKLTLVPGMIDTDGVDEIFLLCRKKATRVPLEDTARLP